MKIQLRLILTAFICGLDFGFILAELQNQLVNQASTGIVNTDGKIQENFQNLFDSIANEDAKKSETYRDILKKEVTNERHAFDVMKNELWNARSRHSNKKRNFHGTNENGGNTVVVKRENPEQKLRAAEKLNTTWKFAKYCDPDPTYELDEIKVEQMFKDMHPDLNNLHRWDEVDRMTVSRLAKICDQILRDLTPPDRNLEERYHYLTVNPTTLQSSRVIRNASVTFDYSGSKPSPVYMTILKCVWNEMTVFLAHGDSKNVFRLDRNPDKTFEFRTGLHPVNYDVD